MRITGKSLGKLGLVFALPLLALAFVAGPAPAADAYVTVVIENPTANTIRYKLRWGANGEYKQFTILPYTTWTHSHVPVDGTDHQAHLRFDWIRGNGQFDEKVYSLPVGRYYFRWYRGDYQDLHPRR